MEDLIDLGCEVLTVLVMLLGTAMLAGTIRMNVEDEKRNVSALRCLGMSKVKIIRCFVEEVYVA
jgi:ABC-type lipoprotein release transport system permease subunit